MSKLRPEWTLIQYDYKGSPVIYVGRLSENGHWIIQKWRDSNDWVTLLDTERLVVFQSKSDGNMKFFVREDLLL